MMDATEFQHASSKLEQCPILYQSIGKGAMVIILFAWLRGRTLVFDRQTFPALLSTYSWQVTIYVGKPSSVGRPTQPFILSGSIGE